MSRIIQQTTWRHDLDIHNLNPLTVGIIRYSYVICLSITFLRASNYVKFENDSFSYTLWHVYLDVQMAASENRESYFTLKQLVRIKWDRCLQK
jgi:hypothetical protein